MLRFTYSPTSDMNIGDLRVALYNYIVSKQRNEDLIIRIEDRDKDNNIEGKDQEMVGILDLFGIKYTQTVYQSQNFRFHTAMALQLMHEKKAFSCFCSDEWLDKKRQESDSKGVPYMYDDACRDLPHELVIDNMNPFRIRIKRPDTDIFVNDYIKGNTSFNSKDIDSFVILEQDKTPRSVFATSVDDMLNDVSLIIRSDKKWIDTPMEDHIRTSLMYDKKIEYAHIPDISNELDETLSVKLLLEDGFLPSAIANYLIMLGNETPKDYFDISDAVSWFDLGKVSKDSVEFNIETLKEVNKKHLLKLDSKELSRYVGFADSEIGDLAKVYLENVSTTKELKSKIEPIFAKKVIPDYLEKSSGLIKNSIKDAPYFEKYDDFKNYIMNNTDVTESEFVIALRYILTGSEEGPDINDIYKYLKNYIGEIVK